MSRRKYPRNNGQNPWNLRNALRFRNKTDAINDETFLDYFYKLENIAISMFHWENLPATVSERFLEKS